MEHGIAVLDEYPVAGLAVLVAVAAIAYAGVSYVLDGTVNVLTTVVFAVVFAVVYVGATTYVERQN